MQIQPKIFGHAERFDFYGKDESHPVYHLRLQVP